MDDRFQQKILDWYESPVRMVRELFDVEPEPWQEEALEQFRRQERMALVANKGPGKSAVLAWCSWNFLLTRPYPKVVATSISGDNLRDGLWSEMAKWRSRSDLLNMMFEWTSTRIFNREKPENWWMAARTWPKQGSNEEQANTLAGIHDDYVLFVIDEAGGVPISVTAAAEAALTGGPKEAHLLMAGNPTSITGPLYKAHVNKNGLWYVIHITGDPDNPKRSRRMTVEYARAQIAEYGRNHPYVMVNIFGEFPPSNANSLIGIDDVQAAMKRYYRPYEIEDAPKIIGVDIAREGDDETVFAYRQGRQVFPLRSFRNINGTEGSRILNREIERWKPDGLFLDGTGGWASSWEDQLVLMGRNPIAVKFNSSAHEKLRFENKRAEMWWDMCNWIRTGGALPPDDELLKELTEITYMIPKDVVILEPKKDLKARLRRSCDRADALCFVAGTMIATPYGSAAIETLRVGDEVWTPFGTSKIALIWETRTSDLTTVDFSNGDRLQGRPQHKIFGYGVGRIRLDALPLTLVVSSLSERTKWLSAKALFIGEKDIGFSTLVDILQGKKRLTASVCCTGAYGWIITARFLMVTKSIIEIAIGATAIFLIWKCSPKLSMTHSTLNNGDLSASAWPRTVISTECENLQNYGTHLKKGENGTGNTEKKRGSTENLLAALAQDAKNHIGRSFQNVVGFVQRVANKQRRFDGILQMSGRAIGAVLRLLPTDTGKRRVVPVNVQTKNVQPTLVYNLTLFEDNAYYANNILVFNCLTFAEPVGIQRQTPLPARRNTSDYDPYAGLNEGMDRKNERNYASDYDPYRSA